VVKIAVGLTLYTRFGDQRAQEMMDKSVPLDMIPFSMRRSEPVKTSRRECCPAELGLTCGRRGPEYYALNAYCLVQNMSMPVAMDGEKTLSACNSHLLNTSSLDRMRRVELYAFVEPEKSLVFFYWPTVSNLARPGPGAQPPLETRYRAAKRMLPRLYDVMLPDPCVEHSAVYDIILVPRRV
jgi:hypothetical protein